MRTRDRLNLGFLQGSLLLSAFLGWLAHSWAVFVIAFLVAIALNIKARQIR